MTATHFRLSNMTFETSFEMLVCKFKLKKAFSLFFRLSYTTPFQFLSWSENENENAFRRICLVSYLCENNPSTKPGKDIIEIIPWVKSAPSHFPRTFNGNWYKPYNYVTLIQAAGAGTGTVSVYPQLKEKRISGLCLVLCFRRTGKVNTTRNMPTW